MNILIVHNYYQQHGGEDTVVQNEKQLLESHGNSVFLYTLNNNEIKEYGLSAKVLLPFKVIFNRKTYKDIARLISENGIDIIHVHNTVLLVSFSVFYVAKKYRIPLVQTLHNFRMACANGLFYRDGKICEECLKKGMLHSVRHKCYRNSRLETFLIALNNIVHRLSGIYSYPYFICLTEFNKQKLLKTGLVDEKKVRIKPNFVFPLKKKDSEKDLFVYAGRLEEIKGIRYLLEAWKLLGNDFPELVLCGSGDLEDYVKEYIERNDIRNIRLMGYVSKEELTDLISRSFALILPTQVYEGFPMSILEANSLGVPVIGSDLGNTGDLIKDGINGIRFIHDSPEDLADKCRFVYEKPFVVDEEFVKKYSAEENYRMLMNIYKEMTDSNESVI